MFFCVSHCEPLYQSQFPNASAPSHDNPAAAPAEVRDHLILYSQTRLVINRLHLIRNAEEQGLSVYRWALPAFSPRPHFQLALMTL